MRGQRSPGWIVRVALLLLLGLVLGCGLPPPVVLVQANPNPLRGQRGFVVMPVAFAAPLRVGQKIEAGYLANKSPDEAKTWEDAKIALNAKLNEGLLAQGLADPTAAFTIRTTVAFIEPGYYVVMDTAPAEVDVEISIADRQGVEIDRLAMRPKAAGFTVTQRIERCGTIAGTMLAKYLRARTR
jgi:hypothetical protein